MVKAVFNQRRKTIRNSLRAAFGDLGGDEHAFFPLRPEVLNVAQFVELTDWVAGRLPRNNSNLILIHEKDHLLGLLLAGNIGLQGGRHGGAACEYLDNPLGIDVTSPRLRVGKSFPASAGTARPLTAFWWPLLRNC